MNLVIPGSTRISPRQQWQALNSGKYRANFTVRKVPLLVPGGK